MTEPHYYHSCSKGLKLETLFASETEFIAGMNRIGVCLKICERENRPVVVVAFCLMGNHVHFILHGKREDCLFFMQKYKQLTGIWISNHRDYKLSEIIEIGIWKIPDNDKLRDKIIYVLRNPIPAGINVTPQGYRWSSARLMFADNSFINVMGKRLSEFSARDLYRKLGTTQKLPDEWYVMPNDLIWPGEYTNYRVAEKRFNNVQDFMFMLNQTKIDKDGNREEMEDFISVPDGDIKSRAVEIAKKLFGKDSIRLCSAEERIDIARIIRKEFKCGYKQLARIFHMDAEELKLVV